MNINSKISEFNADTHTPVGLYMALRNKHRKVCLLESNDYHSRQDSKSFIGLNPIVEIKQMGTNLIIESKNSSKEIPFKKNEKHVTQVQSVLEQFNFSHPDENGFYGRMSFEYTLEDESNIIAPFSDLEIPSLHLFIFQYVIEIDHFTNKGRIIENSLNDLFQLINPEDLLRNASSQELPFELVGNERSMISDKEFLKNVEKGIEHCKKGDVFQLVLSNAFEQSFFGDDFQVYRQLRRLNPSPYLFFFDFEEYRLFGSSPEAQLIVKQGKAEIHPIAGTIPKTGIEETDRMQLEFLLNDEKENAEHTMLVDLARNDLSRDCKNVKVETYKQVQEFSHVSHLVSKVCGEVKTKENFIQLCHSFPAGTLSGTPKPKALELIHLYEPKTRDYYGGTIGMIGANGDLNTAIVIRSILSKNNTMHYRAGAGIVLDSDPQRETDEVHHKLRAVRTAILQTAESFVKKNNINASTEPAI